MSSLSRRRLAAAVATLVVASTVGLAAAASAQKPRSSTLLQRAVARLDLTAQQTADIRAILESHAPELQRQVRSLLRTREKMFRAIHAEAPTEAAIREVGRALSVTEIDLALTRAEIVLEVREVLTDEQQAELQQMAIEARERVEQLLELVLGRLGEPLV